ncbi:deoxycytidylate deaminase [Acetobacterium woodii]|nr:dCMP deaminase family protein [Acetobacterium woodii]
MKRRDYLTWEEYFMGIALLSAQRSKDPNTQVGACIVNGNNIILSTGYNGMPKGCSDDQLPWEREGGFEDTKYAYVCHAELNAILNSDGRSLADSILYVTCFPCNECAKAIIQAGIKKVIYLEDKYPDSEATKVSKKLLAMAQITLKKFSNPSFFADLSLYK